jgi:HAD superfamily hydrolase (TIGR01509 family)
MRTPATRPLGALLFDFDHTLADFGRWVDWQAARDGIQTLYTRVGLDVPTILRQRRGSSPMAVLDAALQARVSETTAAEVRAEAYAILDAVECAGAEHTALLPGARTALDLAAALGLRVGIVTANAARAVDRVLARLGLDGRFGTVVGRSTAYPLKPAPDMFLAALRDLAVEAPAALAVGDSPADAAGAVAAGILAVGVLGGEAGEDRLFEAGASWVLQDLTALPPLLGYWVQEGASQDGPNDLSN